MDSARALAMMSANFAGLAESAAVFVEENVKVPTCLLTTPLVTSVMTCVNIMKGRYTPLLLFALTAIVEYVVLKLPVTFTEYFLLLQQALVLSHVLMRANGMLPTARPLLSTQNAWYSSMLATWMFPAVVIKSPNENITQYLPCCGSLSTTFGVPPHALHLIPLEVAKSGGVLAL